jgi:predicted RNase H-like HicB family nuclease
MPTRNTATVVFIDGTWLECKPGTYVLRAYLIREDDGYSIISANIPGLASCGDTEEDAIANFREAAVGILLSYRAAGIPAPRCEKPRPDYSKMVSVDVNLE